MYSHHWIYSNIYRRQYSYRGKGCISILTLWSFTAAWMTLGMNCTYACSNTVRQLWLKLLTSV